MTCIGCDKPIWFWQRSVPALCGHGQREHVRCHQARNEDIARSEQQWQDFYTKMGWDSKSTLDKILSEGKEGSFPPCRFDTRTPCQQCPEFMHEAWRCGWRPNP
jgi:hypothetical protein